jgi:hypothetical protein
MFSIDKGMFSTEGECFQLKGGCSQLKGFIHEPRGWVLAKNWTWCRTSVFVVRLNLNSNINKAPPKWRINLNRNLLAKMLGIENSSNQDLIVEFWIAETRIAENLSDLCNYCLMVRIGSAIEFSNCRIIVWIVELCLPAWNNWIEECQLRNKKLSAE